MATYTVLYFFRGHGVYHTLSGLYQALSP